MAYLSLQEARDALRIASTDTADDAFLSTLITRVTSEIDQYMRTLRATFVKFEPSTGLTRYYSGDGGRYLLTDDVLAVTTLHERDSGNSSWETAWTTNDYWVPDRLPYNVLEIKDSSTAQTAWTRGRRNFRVVGDFGYATACPADVSQAALEEVIRIYRTRDAGFSDETGVDAQGESVQGGGRNVSRALSARTKRILQAYGQTIFA